MCISSYPQTRLHWGWNQPVPASNTGKYLVSVIAISRYRCKDTMALLVRELSHSRVTASATGLLAAHKLTIRQDEVGGITESERDEQRPG